MEQEILKYYENENINFSLEENNFYTFIGDLNSHIIKNLLFKDSIYSIIEQDLLPLIF